MHGDEPDGRSPPRFAWLFEMPAFTERAMRMEGLIARLRVLILVTNGLLLAFFLDTRDMHVTPAWWVIFLCLFYAVPIVAFQPYKRWRVFRTSIVSATLDSIAITAFVALTGGASSPFFPLYYLSAVAVAMRFELRQALVACCIYAFMYAVAYFATWDPGRNALGEYLMQVAYMFFAAIGVGHLAREENERARQVVEIERLNAENQRLMTNKERAARIDKLTGLLNRASLEKDAQKEVRKARTAGTHVSVLFCDMDKLKRINDEPGHDAGDRVLRQVGVVLKKGLRAQDLIGRYGGDEFVILLPNLARETVYDRALQLIENVQTLNEHIPSGLTVGLSVGIASFPMDAPDYTTLVKVADQAMYLAKREGGNCIRTSNDLRLFWEDVPKVS